MRYIREMGKKIRAFFQSGFGGLGEGFVSLGSAFYEQEPETFYTPTDWNKILKDRPKSIQAAFRRDARNIGRDMYKAMDKVNGQTKQSSK